MPVYFEDLAAGQVREFGGRTLSREEIVDFARQFDPQPFHLDEERARESIYGGLIASGWHTIALCMRMLVDGFVNDSVSLGSPGADEIRWLKPVRPGDTVRLRVTCVETKASESRPDRGLARFRYEVTNQRGELVMTMKGAGLFGRRPPE
jgi:acyl dehydratase